LLKDAPPVLDLFAVNLLLDQPGLLGADHVIPLAVNDAGGAREIAAEIHVGIETVITVAVIGKDPWKAEAAGKGIGGKGHAGYVRARSAKGKTALRNRRRARGKSGQDAGPRECRLGESRVEARKPGLEKRRLESRLGKLQECRIEARSEKGRIDPGLVAGH